MKRRYMIYDLHLSETMLSTDTVAQTLYLCLSRILAREYEMTVQLLRSLRTDVPFSRDATRLLNLIMGIEDTHPNAISVIFSVYQLARSNGYVLEEGAEGKSAMKEEMHVSAVCRPTTAAMLDVVSMDARDKRIEVNCPRDNMRGGKAAGIYGYLARAKDTVNDINMEYCSDVFHTVFETHKRYDWKKIQKLGPNEQIQTMGELLDATPEGESLFNVYWTLVSGLRTTSNGSSDRELVLRVVRMYIGQHLQQHGDRSLFLALLTVVWKLAESGNIPKWPFVTDGGVSEVRGNVLYFWRLQESDTGPGGNWSNTGNDCLKAIAKMAQVAMGSATIDWGKDHESEAGPHMHEAFPLPDYQSHPRGAPTADTIDQASVDVSPLHMCDADASFELDPHSLQCLASPKVGVLGMLPISHLTGNQAGPQLQVLDPETGEPTKLSTAQRLLYDAMSEGSVETKQWQEIAEVFEDALKSLTSQAELEEAHGGLGYAYTQLAEADKAEIHLNKSLPFDLSQHAATKSRIAREMMTRVSLDYQAYIKGQRTASEPFLACLPPAMLDLQLARADGRSSAPVNFAETIQGLRGVQKYLEAVREFDMEFLLVATQSLTAKCNKILDDDEASSDRLEERCVFSLQRAAWYRPAISFSYLTGSILSSSMEKDLQTLNPFLESKSVASIRTMTVGVLLRSNRASWINITMGQVRKSIELVNSTLESLIICNGYAMPEARLACVKHGYQWRSDATETAEVLPLAWLKQEEAKLLEMTTEADLGDVDRTLILRYCGYDSAKAFAMLNDVAEIAHVEQLCKRKCCDDRAARVRDATMQTSGDAKMQAAQTMKTNLLMLKDSTKSAAGLLNGRRCYASAGGATHYRGPLGQEIQTEKWSLDPRVLLFEYKFGFILRGRQYELTKELEGAAQLGESRCNQMIMGAGKTTVIGPLLAMMLSGTKPAGDNNSIGRLVIQCVPGALLAMSIDVMRSTFSTVISSNYSNSYHSLSARDVSESLPV